MPQILRIKKPGDIDSLHLANEPSCGLPDKHIRIRLSSIGLNRADLLYCQGRYFSKPATNSRIGFEGAGIVEEIADSNCTNLLGTTIQVGDLVATCPMSLSPQTQGCLAGSVDLLPEQILPIPLSVQPENAAALWVAYLTAWGGLFEQGNLTHGQTVIITAASSSVGLAAIALAKQAGAKVIACTSSQEKLSPLKREGADAVIIQPKDESALDSFASDILNSNDNKGSDLIFDAVAGPSSYALIKSARQGARYIIHGLLDRRPMNVHAGVLMKRQLTLKGYTLDETLNNKKQKIKAVRELFSAFENQHLPLHVAKRFALAEYREAFEYLRSNQQFGKVLIIP